MQEVSDLSVSALLVPPPRAQLPQLERCGDGRQEDAEALGCLEYCCQWMKPDTYHSEEQILTWIHLLTILNMPK